jgi:hypothetical protein
MKDTVKISHNTLNKLSEFIVNYLNESFLEANGNEDLKYIINVTDALMAAKYSLELYKNEDQVFIEIEQLEFLLNQVHESFEYIGTDTDWNCLSDMLETNLLASAILEARQAMQIELKTKEEQSK